MNRLGCLLDPAKTEAYCNRLAAAGHAPTFAAAKPALKGYWNSLVARGVYGVFLWDAEVELFGRMLPADSQARGTCVGRGVYRACQDSYYHALVQRGDVGVAKSLCFELIYAGCRVLIGKSELGRGDGAYGVWASEYVNAYGLLPRGRYGTFDLTEPREDFAVSWGYRVGPPPELLTASKEHPVAACHLCETMDDLADATAAGYASAFCSNTLWQNPSGRNSRDQNGMCKPVMSGGHAEEVRGVFLDESDRLCFVRQNSWGGEPGGPSMLRFKGGTRELPQGAYGAYASDMQKALRGGESWAFGSVIGWRSE